jgi:hypothetical protein
MTTAYANQIHLNNRCEFMFSGKNAYAPLGHCKARDLGEWMDSLCRESVEIEFRTSDKHKVADIAKFSRRLDDVSGWEFAPWETPVIDGHTINGVMRCTATRKPGQKSANEIAAEEEIAAKSAEVSRLESSCGTGHDVRRMVHLRDQIEELESAL